MASPEDLARQVIELTDRQDWPAREALLTPDCTVFTPQGVLRGRAATTAFSRPFVGAFSGARHQIDLIVSSGDDVVVEGLWTGTHTEPLVTPGGEIPATGKAINLPFVAIHRVSGELIASLHLYFDQLTLMGQLGLVPHPQAA